MRSEQIRHLGKSNAEYRNDGVNVSLEPLYSKADSKCRVAFQDSPGVVTQPPAQPELDPEELQEARAKQKAEGPSGLFSAASAGILPSFLVPDGAEQQQEPQNGDVSIADGETA